MKTMCTNVAKIFRRIFGSTKIFDSKFRIYFLKILDSFWLSFEYLVIWMSNISKYKKLSKILFDIFIRLLFNIFIRLLFDIFIWILFDIFIQMLFDIRLIFLVLVPGISKYLNFEYWIHIFNMITVLFLNYHFNRIPK